MEAPISRPQPKPHTELQPLPQTKLKPELQGEQSLEAGSDGKVLIMT